MATKRTVTVTAKVKRAVAAWKKAERYRALADKAEAESNECVRTMTPQETAQWAKLAGEVV